MAVLAERSSQSRAGAWGQVGAHARPALAAALPRAEGRQAGNPDPVEVFLELPAAAASAPEMLAAARERALQDPGVSQCSTYPVLAASGPIRPGSELVSWALTETMSVPLCPTALAWLTCLHTELVPLPSACPRPVLLLLGKMLWPLCCACLQGRRQPGKGQRKRIIQRKTSRDFRLQLDISSIMEQRKRAFTVSSIELCNMSTLKGTNNNRAGLFHFLFSALMRFFSITKNFTTEYFCPYKFGGVTKFINTLEPPESKIQIHKVCGTCYFKCCCFTVL